jgi:glycosyltransferase involved in cell wall biosynthesis
MIAYHYPPEGSSSGVLRTLKFSRYLPAYGWTPHVLTLRESLYRVKDTSLVQEIPPEATVHRTAAFDTARHLSLRGRYFGFMAIPDRFVSWYPFAVTRGREVIREEGIHVLFSTSPLPTAHLVAGTLKVQTGLPWIADFRDPWIEEGTYPRPGSLRYWCESRLERFVLSRADRITTTTPEFSQDLMARYPDLPSEKFSAILNGFDEEDFRELSDSKGLDRFEILHAGLVTPEYRDPLPFLRIVSQVIQDRTLPREEVRITFLGGGSYLESSAFHHAVADLGLSDLVQVLPRIPHREALRRLRDAAVLLLLQASDDTRSLIPAKTFEYLRVGRPILAVTCEGATSEMVRKANAGVVVHPADAEKMRRALLDLYARREEAAHHRNGTLIQRFNRQALTGELANLLDELVPAPSDGARAMHLASASSPGGCG